MARGRIATLLWMARDPDRMQGMKRILPTVSKGVTLKTSCQALLIVVLLCGLIGLARGQGGEKQPVAAADTLDVSTSPAAAASLPAEGIYLEGFRLDITRSGVTRQKLTSVKGRYDQKRGTLDLDGLHVLFFDGPTTRGEATSGHGRLWLQADPAKKIEKDEILLDKTVRFDTDEGWVLQSSLMRFRQSDSTLRTDQGYVKQLPLDKGFLIDKGKSFEITLSLDKNTFTSWREMGDAKTGEQVTIVKSDKPVIKP